MNDQLDAELTRRLAAATGISSIDYGVLVHLTETEGGTMRLFELSGALGWEKSRLSHHLNRMVTRGFVEKVPCDDDKRGSNVVLTAAGRAAIEAAAPGHVHDVRQLFFDRLSRSQVEQLEAIAASVLAGLDFDPANI